MVSWYKQVVVIIVLILISLVAYCEEEGEEAASACLRYPCQKVFWISKEGEFTSQYRKKAAATGIPNDALGCGIVVKLYPNCAFDFGADPALKSGKITGIAVEYDSIFPRRDYKHHDIVKVLKQFVLDVSKLTGLRSLVFLCRIPRPIDLSPLANLTGLQCLSLVHGSAANVDFISKLKQLIWLGCVIQNIDYVDGEAWHLENLRYLDVVYDGNSENCRKIVLGDKKRPLRIKATIEDRRLDRNSFDWLPEWAELCDLAICNSKIDEVALETERFRHVTKLLLSDMQDGENIANIILCVKNTVASVKLQNIDTYEKVYEALSDCERLTDIELTSVVIAGVINSKCKLERLVIDSQSYRSIAISSCEKLKSLEICDIEEARHYKEYLSLLSLENVSIVCYNSAVARDALSLLVNPARLQLIVYSDAIAYYGILVDEY